MFRNIHSGMQKQQAGATKITAQHVRAGNNSDGSGNIWQQYVVEETVPQQQQPVRPAHGPEALGHAGASSSAAQEPLNGQAEGETTARSAACWHQ